MPRYLDVPQIAAGVAPIQSYVTIGLERVTNPEANAVNAGSHWLGGGDLIQPIRANLTVYADEVIAQEPTTEVFGVGDTPSEALIDLRLALKDHLQVLASAGNLSEDLQRQLDFLVSHVRG